MTETAFHTPEANAGRLAEPFPMDPWNGRQGAALQYAGEARDGIPAAAGWSRPRWIMRGFCQMLLNGGTLDGNRIIGRKTLELMASDHLSASVKGRVAVMPPGHGFGLGFTVRTHRGVAPFPARSASSSGAAWPVRSSSSIRLRNLSRCS